MTAAGYRGDVRVQGRRLRGWLAKVNAPAEQVAFELVIDGMVRGSYVADAVHGSLERQSAFGGGLHGFSLQLDRDWILGANQTVALYAAGTPTGVELHAALGPTTGEYFEEQEPRPVRRALGAEEAAAARELTELRRRRNDPNETGDHENIERRYFELLGAASRAESVDTGWSRSLLLARELYEDQHYEDALGVADRVLAQAPDGFRMLLTKGRSLVALNRPAEAQDTFLHAQEIEPENLAAKVNARLAAALAAEAPRANVHRAEVPVLIAVGGGLGDLLHATPTIRNIARRTGARVDVVVAEEYPGNLFLLEHAEFVNRVFGLGQEVLGRQYVTVFVSHFFGELRPPFRGDRVIWSRARDRLLPGSAHETIFNLESARALLDVPYDADDGAHYYLGDLQYRKPREPLIGFHGGSKSGHWLVKRWPHFAELAERLKTRGLRVASFGVPDEYVPGTEDRTGGTVREMCERMLACSYFVSNDSGVMNIANALGIPLLALFAPTDAATLLPLRPTSVALALEKVCAPCHRKNHAFFLSGECRCIGEISVEVVEQEILQRIAGEGGERVRHVR